ncbi:hypothetical protein MXMO3_01816 [Maritalea myrionectae]|uniref:Uncharacterized protein n=1 Tax=Maritalea myrionectae TaxID=454601 RepID=A0A2R4ME74_9HYPH|nr:hypothetical protein [Maritalea myrionectae]AVX04341.1 hypothetical protein MXMO3_01816 [Maritalea myrionectae]
MGFYDDMQAVATELLTEFNQGTVTLKRTTPGAPNPDEPWEPVPDNTVTYRLNSTTRAVADKFIDGTTIFATDAMVTASAVMTKTHVDGSPVTEVEEAFEAKPGDQISIDGKEVEVIRTMRVPKAGTAIVWKFIVRG